MTIRSHFVPQFYLRNFGERLYFYDKTTGKVTESNPSDLALKKNFYGATDENKSNPVESSMSRLEGNANVAISKIISTQKYSNLSEEETTNMCSFVALQYLRTQEARIRIMQTGHKLFDEIAKRSGVTDWEIRYTKEGEMGTHLDIMKEFAPIAAVIRRMGTIIYINDTDIPLWTSDNPVTLHNEHDQFPFGNLGIASKGIEIHLPLSPKIEIMFYDPVTYKEGIMPESSSMEKDNVIHENNLQAVWSTRFMYSNTDEFYMADKYLQASPDSTDVDRKRLGTGIHEMTPKDFEGKEIHNRPEFWMDPGDVEKFRDRLDKEDSK